MTFSVPERKRTMLTNTNFLHGCHKKIYAENHSQHKEPGFQIKS